MASASPVPVLTRASRRPAANPVVHLVTSRSSALRLAPLATELRARGLPQGVLDLRSPLPELGAPPGAAGGSRLATGSAAAMAAVEAYVAKLRPGGLVVAGDSDQTLACALAADRLGVPIARLGAGLRCHDWSLREEVNRVLLDTLADLLLTDHLEAEQTLAATGAPADRIRCVGNTLADLALASREAALGRRPWEAAGLPAREYVLITLHRRENVAEEGRARTTLDAVIALAKRVPVLLVLEPGASCALAAADELERLRAAGVRLSAPLDHLDFLGLEACAGAVVTDSAGVQEETTVLGVPCYTLRATSERVVTLTEGTNMLIGDDPADIAALRPSGPGRPPVIPYWDGEASARVADELVAWLEDAQ